MRKIKSKYITTDIDDSDPHNNCFVHTVRVKIRTRKRMTEEEINSALVKELLEVEENLASDIFDRPDNFETFFKGFAKREKK